MKPEEAARLLEALNSAQWHTFFAALAAGILTILFAALVSYLREKGKHWATRENFEKILQEKIDTKHAMEKAALESLATTIEFKMKTATAETIASRKAEFEMIRMNLDAIRSQEAEKESGKMDAVDKNLKRILKKVKAVTTTTEEIKQKIADEIWVRQMIRNEKRSIYADLCKIIGGLIHNHEMMRESVRKIKGDTSEVMDLFEDYHEKINRKRKEPPPELLPYVEEHIRLTKLLHESSTLLRVYCRPQALRAFDEFVAARLGSTNRIEISKALENLRVLEKRIASIASFDLELPVHGFSIENEERPISEITCPQCFHVSKVNRPDPNKPGTPTITCPGCKLKFEVSF